MNRIKNFIPLLLAFAVGTGTGHFAPEALKSPEQIIKPADLPTIEAQEAETDADQVAIYEWDVWCNCALPDTLDGGAAFPAIPFEQVVLTRKIVKTRLGPKRVDVAYLNKIGFCKPGRAVTVIDVGK